jgi:hypothetical protein
MANSGILNLRTADVFCAVRVYFFNIVALYMMRNSYPISENMIVDVNILQYLREQLFSMKSVKPRSRARLIDEHFEGCM